MPKLYEPASPQWSESVDVARRALSNPGRFEILAQMAERDSFRAPDLDRSRGLSQTAITTGLTGLEDRGFIECDLPKGERRGWWPNYRVVTPAIREALFGILEHFPDREWVPFEEVDKPDPRRHG
jgi:DNA-binding transcriptional ArsR family regulator